MSQKKKIVFDLYNVIYNPLQGILDIKVIDIISSLHENGFSIYIFTSTSQSNLEKVFSGDNAEYLEYFSKIISAGELKKNTPEAYEYLSKEIACIPSETIFIDDAMQNIWAAEEFGLKAIQYIDPESLEEQIWNIIKN